LITNWERIAKEATPADRRKETRVNLTFSIAISTSNQKGDLVTERTKTLDISEFGCRLATRLPLNKGDVLTISLVGPDGKNAPPQKPGRFEVMWTTEESDARIIGARQTEGDSLWNVSFPTFKRSPNSSSR
jgi:c-di-GMP-binding flagellar brake protein YcgR